MDPLNPDHDPAHEPMRGATTDQAEQADRTAVAGPADRPVTAPKRSLWRGLGIGAVAVAAVAGSLVAAGAASAQNDGDASDVKGAERVDAPAEVQVLTDADGAVFALGGDHFEVSPEDQAVWDRFDQCLVDAGVDFEKIEAEFDAFEKDELTDAEIDELEERFAATEDDLDAAFAQCDPILEDLSDQWQALEGDFENEFDMAFGAWDLSPEDEAVIEQFEQCLAANGLTEEKEAELDAKDEITDEEIAELDAAFDECEPILDELSEGDFFLDVEGCDEHELDDNDVEESAAA